MFTLYFHKTLFVFCKRKLIEKTTLFSHKLILRNWNLKTNKQIKTFNNGYLGSRIDEERSEMRYIMWIAELSESSNFWTHIALSGSPESILIWVSFINFQFPLFFFELMGIWLCEKLTLIFSFEIEDVSFFKFNLFIEQSDCFTPNQIKQQCNLNSYFIWFTFLNSKNSICLEFSFKTYFIMIMPWDITLYLTCFIWDTIYLSIKVLVLHLFNVSSYSIQIMTSN